jgi:hypothetical protein
MVNREVNSMLQYIQNEAPSPLDVFPFDPADQSRTNAIPDTTLYAELLNQAVQEHESEKNFVKLLFGN